jgi:UDP-N-acetyl-D-mannosaminuronic acid dehydrogenase
MLTSGAAKNTLEPWIKKEDSGMGDQIQVVVLGGCGHIGLPLCIRLALAGWSVAAMDVNKEAVSAVNEGKMLFKENKGDQLLAEALATGRFRATTDVTVCQSAPIVIFTNGMDLDENGNPKLDALFAVFDAVVQQQVSDDRLFIFRSTLYPGTMTLLQEHLATTCPQGKMVGRLAYCPERTAEMYALEEIVQLPQVSVPRYTPTPTLSKKKKINPSNTQQICPGVFSNLFLLLLDHIGVR